MIFDENLDEKTRQIDTIILYDPGIKIGRLLSISGVYKNADHYFLEDLMDPENNKEPYDVATHWFDWDIEMVCATVTFGRMEESGSFVRRVGTMHFEPGNKDIAYFSYDGTIFKHLFHGEHLEDLFNNCRAMYQEDPRP